MGSNKQKTILKFIKIGVSLIIADVPQKKGLFGDKLKKCSKFSEDKT